MLSKLLCFVGWVVLFILCLIVIVPPMLLLKLMFALIGCRTMITEEEVYDLLSYTEWKTGQELTDEIRVLRLKQQPYAAMLDSVYPALYHMEVSGLVEHRERQISEEKRRVRGNRGQYEYRRKPGGKRIEKERGSWFVLPVPVPSWAGA